MIKLKNIKTGEILTLNQYASKYTNLVYTDIESICKSIDEDIYYLLDECGNWDYINTKEWEIIVENIARNIKPNGIADDDIKRLEQLKKIQTKDELLKYCINYIFDELQYISDEAIKIHYQTIISKYYDISNGNNLDKDFISYFK